MIDLFFFCSHQFLMISWFDFSIMMPYYLWTLFPWPFENVHFILNIQLIKVFYGWQSVNGIVIQSSITLLHTRHTGPGSRTADRVITATLTQHNRFRFTFFADTRPWPASPTRCQNISSHTHEYEQAGTRCMSGPCLLLAAWQMGRSEGRARHCPCLPSACFQQHNIPPRPLHKFSAQIFDSDWWICCAWPMTGRDCVRAILRMFEMLCVLTSRWKRDYFVCQKPDIRTCSGGPARHCTDSVE